ncbi:MAG: hypothetical protein JJU05_01275 [Verrucomicrobia bacterium]|nr:hypothetical protein [Verrucomicrobiota bacterium]MCH8525885.1 hypothetical protein [Kiritimatiellia bacterium]
MLRHVRGEFFKHILCRIRAGIGFKKHIEKFKPQVSIQQACPCEGFFCIGHLRTEEQNGIRREQMIKREPVLIRLRRELRRKIMLFQDQFDVLSVNKLEILTERHFCKEQI